MRRAEFKAAIEAGISAAGIAFTAQERRALRRVGETATETVVGAWEIEGVGCPLVQADINRVHGSRNRFWIGYEIALPSYSKGVHRITKR